MALCARRRVHMTHVHRDGLGTNGPVPVCHCTARLLSVLGLSPHTVARRALAQNVNETFSAPGVPAIMDFDFVPWGNAYFAAVTGNKTYDRGPGMTSWLEQCGMGVKSPPADCFTGEILCQHGPNECMGNLIEGCVKDLNPTDYWPFVACYEEPPNPSRTDPTCVPSCEQPQASSCPR